MRTLIVPLLLLLAGPARATPAAMVAPHDDLASMTLEEFAADLLSEDPPTRKLAARALKRRVKTELRRSTRRPGSLDQQQALVDLLDYDRLVAPRCIQSLQHENTRALCADVLGLLETREALEPLRTALHTEPEAGIRKRLERAIHLIEAAQADAPQ